MQIKTVILTLLVFLLGFGSAYIFFTNKPSLVPPSPSTQPTPTTEKTPAPILTVTVTTAPTSSPAPTSTIPAGWLTYTNKSLGFSISYPSTYKTLDDKENLSGWKNDVVLIYKGGQSYDLVIQQWKSEAEYKAQYPNATSELTVYKIGSTFITLLNSNKDAEVSTIINTFKQL